MATDKKHIAVYLAPEVEQALIAFCQEKGLISKKGTMYSAGVNAALAAFFGISDINNILQSSSNTPAKPSNIPSGKPSTIPSSQHSTTPNNTGNIPSSQHSTTPNNTGNIPSNIPSEVLAVEVMPGK
jgi:hypothetical protein